MGELTQSFAQVTNAINQTKQQNLNRDVAQANFSFRQQESDLANRQFDAQQIQQQRANLIETAEKSMAFYTDIAAVLPPELQEKAFGYVSDNYRRAGLIPEGAAFDFQSAEDASMRVNERMLRGDIPGAQAALSDFQNRGFKSVVNANLPRIKADAAIIEKTGEFKNIIDLRGKGQAYSDSEFEHIKRTDPERASGIDQAKQVYRDETMQAADARAEEMEAWRKVDPAILNELVEIQRIVDINGAESLTDPQKRIAAIGNQYRSLVATKSNLVASQHDVPDSLEEAIAFNRALLGGGEKVPVENQEARDRRKKLKAETADIQSKIASRTIENVRVGAQIDVLKATLPKIAQTVENMKAVGENIEVKTALFKTRVEAEQKKMQALAPRLIEARDQLTQEGEDLYARLDELSTDRDGNNNAEIERISEQIKSNAQSVHDLNIQIDFAEKVGPEMFLAYEHLGARLEDMELRRNKNTEVIDSFKQQKQALVAAQTEGKLSENQRKAQGDERLALVARASRELNLDSKSLQKDAQAWLKANDPDNLVSIQDIVKGAGVKQPLNVNLSTGPTTAARTRSQETQDKSAFALTYLDKLESVADSSTVGGVGKLRAFVHGLGQQASAFTKEFKGDRNRAIATIAEKGGDIDESIFFDSKLTQYQMQARLSAFFMADAIADQSGRALSDQDRKAFEHALGFNDNITGVEQIKDNINTARELLQEKLKVAGARLGVPSPHEPQQESNLPDLSGESDESLLKILGIGAE